MLLEVLKSATFFSPRPLIISELPHPDSLKFPENVGINVEMSFTVIFMSVKIKSKHREAGGAQLQSAQERSVIVKQSLPLTSLRL
jgi:hypothetical protein